jgi:hypothetical protein
LVVGKRITSDPAGDPQTEKFGHKQEGLHRSQSAQAKDYYFPALNLQPPPWSVRKALEAAGHSSGL